MKDNMMRQQRTDAEACKESSKRQAAEKDQHSAEHDGEKNESTSPVLKKDDVGRLKRKPYCKQDCIQCGKILANRHSLWRHKKTCIRF